ncbi:hypothetical protein OESDEN_21392 [Oesophagostomum dentatum]|uniref:Uncharacterized protein n=1 Tax=Oesophagostomum dentatum TaxID=61180 RepID=A0A0B1S221_OESDE|nr:hypothetical protein OESDEN_21392 [Oesophagostomum dentatum]
MQLTKVLETVVEQMRLSALKDEVVVRRPCLPPVRSARKYDQLGKNAQQFVPDEETGSICNGWFKRFEPLIRISALLDGRKRDLIFAQLDEDASKACRYTTAKILQEPFASKKTLIIKRYKIRSSTSPVHLRAILRGYASTMKRIDEELKRDYIELKAPQLVMGLQDPSLEKSVSEGFIVRYTYGRDAADD